MLLVALHIALYYGHGIALCKRRAIGKQRAAKGFIVIHPRYLTEPSRNVPVVICGRRALKHDSICGEASEKDLGRKRIDLNAPFPELPIDNRACRSQGFRDDVDRGLHPWWRKSVMIYDLDDRGLFDARDALLRLIVIDKDDTLHRLIEEAASCHETAPYPIGEDR